MRARRTSTGARWKTCKKALSTAISPRSAEAIWRLLPGRYLLMSHRSFVWLCLLPLAVVTAAFFLLPMARLVVTGAEGPQGLAGYLPILTEPRYRATLVNTVLLAAATTIVTLIVATVAGMFLQRHRFPGRAVLIAMLTFPLAFPGVVVGFLIILLAGRQGLIGDLSSRVFDEKLVFAYSIYGLFLGYLYFSVPRVILTIMAAVQKLDIGLEEAARSLGASPWAVQRDVVLPALAPAFVASGAIAFTTAMGAFGTAFTLATNIDVLPMLIYTEFTLAANFATSAALSVLAGVTVNYFRGISSGVTLQWVAQVWDLYAGTIALSFLIAFATLAVTLIAGVPAAYALHVRGGRLARVVEEVITLPLAIPGLAIALALLLTYQGFGEFRRSWLFILTGHVVFTMPFMVRSVMAVFATVDIKTLDEGAASLGASPWRRFRDVIVPNAVPGILAGALMVVTLSLGEFNLTWMLHTPLTKTLPIGLADSS